MEKGNPSEQLGQTGSAGRAGDRAADVVGVVRARGRHGVVDIGSARIAGRGKAGSEALDLRSMWGGREIDRSSRPGSDRNG